MDKPRIPVAQLEHYNRVKALDVDTEVVFAGKPAGFIGMTGHIITLRVSRKTKYVRVWNPEVMQIEIQP